MLEKERFHREPLPHYIKFSFTMGQFADSLPYTLFFFFYLMFLTDLVGIPPMIAGLMIFVAFVWDAIMDLIIGAISDRFTLPVKARRALMITALIPFSLMTLLLFTNLERMVMIYKELYYTLIIILFLLDYKAFSSSYRSLGAELAQGFEEQILILKRGRFIFYASVLIASTTPIIIVSLSKNRWNFTNSGGWILVGAIFAVVTLIFGLMAWRSTKRCELSVSVERKTNPFREESAQLPSILRLILPIFELLKLSSIRSFTLSLFFWSSARTMIGGSLIYLFIHLLNYSAEKTSLCYLIVSGVAILWLPLINHLSHLFDKHLYYSLSMGVSGLTIFLFYFLGLDHIGLLILYFLFFQLGNRFFERIHTTMIHDIYTLDQFASGKKRRGSISAITLCAKKMGNGIALLIIGAVLGSYGYDGAQLMQSESAKTAILSLMTWIPGLLAIFGGIAAFIYPLTQKRLENLNVALSAKRNGMAYKINPDVEKLLK